MQAMPLRRGFTSTVAELLELYAYESVAKAYKKEGVIMSDEPEERYTKSPERKTLDADGVEDKSWEENFPQAAAQGLEDVSNLEYEMSPGIRAARARLAAKKEAARKAASDEEPAPVETEPEQE